MNSREILLGPAYYRHVRLINDSASWTAEQVEAFRRPWREEFRAEFEADVTYDKAHYRALAERPATWTDKALCKRVTTGGTTGTPLAFYLDRFYSRQKERAYIFDVWKDVGYSPFDARVVFRGNIPDSLVRYDWKENAHIVSPNRLNGGSAAELTAILERIGPFFLHVYPSSLETFVATLGPKNLSRLVIRGIMAGSEAFPLDQMKRARATFGCPVCHWYGHSEYAVLAKFCWTCEGFHFYPTYGLAEFLRVSNEHHEVVVTAFRKIGTRFVRYRTEDLVAKSDKSCRASSFERVDAIVGRVQEYFVDREGTKRAFGPFLFGIHGSFWDCIRDVQFIQREPGRLLCRLIIKSVDDKARLQIFLRERFATVDLDFEFVDSLSKTASGKRRFFVSQLTG